VVVEDNKGTEGLEEEEMLEVGGGDELSLRNVVEL